MGRSATSLSPVLNKIPISLSFPPSLPPSLPLPLAVDKNLTKKRHAVATEEGLPSPGVAPDGLSAAMTLAESKHDTCWRQTPWSPDLGEQNLVSTWAGGKDVAIPLWRETWGCGPRGRHRGWENPGCVTLACRVQAGGCARDGFGEAVLVNHRLKVGTQAWDGTHGAWWGA